MRVPGSPLDPSKNFMNWFQFKTEIRLQKLLLFDHFGGLKTLVFVNYLPIPTVLTVDMITIVEIITQSEKKKYK